MISQLRIFFYEKIVLRKKIKNNIKASFVKFKLLKKTYNLRQNTS